MKNKPYIKIERTEGRGYHLGIYGKNAELVQLLTNTLCQHPDVLQLFVTSLSCIIEEGIHAIKNANVNKGV